MFPVELLNQAERLLTAMRSRGLLLVTAESCTGGLVSALLTEIAGSSDVVDRGFVTYSNAAKAEALGVDPALIERHGAVSREVAEAMADGALKHSRANIAVAVTGIAGPGGGAVEKPVGLVFIAVARRSGPRTVQKKLYGDVGRSAVRLATLRDALAMVEHEISA